MQTAKRIQAIPPYLFAEIDKKIAAARAAGVDVISFGIGDPDRPTPAPVVHRLQQAAEDPANHRYPSYEGLPTFRQAVADWYARRFGVDLDPDKEIVSLIGSKEGIAHLPLCYVNPGDYTLVPDPGYPVYALGTLFADGNPYSFPLDSRHGFLPDFSTIPSDVAQQAKILYLNYPNNPTGAVADLHFFAEAVEFARSYDLLVCHDAAYTEVAFDGYRAPSFLQTPGAKEVGIEFHSLSKTYNMTGWRLGWAAGNPSAIEALGRLKTNVDSGVFQAIQYAGITALQLPDAWITSMQRVYQERRDLLVAGLRELGAPVTKPRASIYVWVPVPAGETSTSFATGLLERAGIVVTPGVGYGANGEGYVRFSLCLEKERMDEGLRRLRQAGIRWPSV